jgi:hypothetical protein
VNGTEIGPIKMDFKEIGWEYVAWIHLDQHRVQWRVPVRKMNVRDPQKRGISWLAEHLFSSQWVFSIDLLIYWEHKYVSTGYNNLCLTA